MVQFGELFEKKFKTLPNIKQYHHFRFNNLPENKGKVFVSMNLVVKKNLLIF